jgi:hypothetical protein
MARNDDLGRLLSAAFADEGERMGIDASSGRARLRSEVERQEHLRRRTWLVAAVVVAVLAAAGLAGWIDGGRRGDVAPAHGAASVSQASVPAPPNWPFFLDLDTGTRTPLPGNLAPSTPYFGTEFAISPNGQWIAYSRCSMAPGGCGGPSEVAAMRMDGSDRVAVTLKAGESASGLVWSPLGDRIALQVTRTGYTGDVGEINVYDLATSTFVPVTNIPLDSASRNDLTFCFSKDGNAILYDLPRESRSPTDWDIWDQPVAGGEASILLEHAKSPLDFGSGLLYLEPGPEGRGYAMRFFGPSGERRVIGAVEGIGNLRLSPDSTRAAYEDDGVRVVNLFTGVSTRYGDGNPMGWVDGHTILVMP